MLCLTDEEHATEQEHGNPEDQFAVAIVKSGTGVIGYKYPKPAECSWQGMGQK